MKPPFVMSPAWRSCALAALLCSGGGAAMAEPYRLLLSTRGDADAGQEVFVATYGSYNALVASPAAVSGDFSGIDVAPGYTAVALTYDGRYRLLLTTRADGPAGGEVFIASYNSYADFVASPAAVGGDFSGIDVAPGYTVSGLAYDGKYRLMLTTRVDGAAGDEVFIATYDSFADLVSSPAAVGGNFSGIDVASAYTATGLAYDGKYRLMLTTRADGAAGGEVFIATYDSFAELVASPAAVGGDFSGIDVSPAYQARGFTVEFGNATPPPGGTVPEPATWALVAAALGMGAAQRRRSAQRRR